MIFKNCLIRLKLWTKKKFNFCVGSAFTLFENNLLKGLQNLYKEKEREQKEENGEIKENKEDKNDNINNINNEDKNIINKVKSQAENDDIL